MLANILLILCWLIRVDAISMQYQYKSWVSQHKHQNNCMRIIEKQKKKIFLFTMCIEWNLLVWLGKCTDNDSIEVIWNRDQIVKGKFINGKNRLKWNSEMETQPQTPTDVWCSILKTLRGFHAWTFLFTA